MLINDDFVTFDSVFLKISGRDLKTVGDTFKFPIKFRPVNFLLYIIDP